VRTKCRKLYFKAKLRLSTNCNHRKIPSSQKKQRNSLANDFSIRFKEIVVTENYKQWKPDPYELEKLMKYYEEHKKLDKPVLVKIKNGRYKLKDNFLQYYVAKKLHKTWVKATMDAKYLNEKSK